MGCCVGREELSPSNHLIIDVQQIIADDAWHEFVISNRRPWPCRLGRRAMKRSDYTVEAPMNYYLFEETQQEVHTMRRLPSLKSNDVAAKPCSSSGPKDLNHPDQVGLKTKFKNDTDKDQTYNFRFEKTRRATMEVTYQKGFSIGGSASFKLGLPQVLPNGELGTEINMNYEVTSAKGQTFEETVTTEATSEIVVSKHSRCTANIVMEERRLLAEFKLWVRMSMPAGQALVFIRNKEGRTVFIKVIDNLSMLFPEHTFKDDHGDTREDAVQFIIHGVVDGRQLANHYIHLKGRKIPPAKTATKGNATRGDGEGDGDGASKGEGKERKDFSDVEFSDF